MIIRPGDKICLAVEKFKFVRYYEKDNIFECSINLDDEVTRYEKPSTLRRNRFTIPGVFSGLRVEPAMEYFIPESKNIPDFQGRVWPGERFKIKDEYGNEWSIEEDWNFSATGMYTLHPTGGWSGVFNQTEPIRKKAPQRLALEQPGQKLVGETWTGDNINGICDRIYSYLYKLDENGTRTRDPNSIAYFDVLDTREVPTYHRLFRIVMVDQDYMEWAFPAQLITKQSSSEE